MHHRYLIAAKALFFCHITPLSNNPDRSFGTAIGSQMYFNHGRQQLIFELGGRDSTSTNNQGVLALGTNYQHAIGKHLILRLSGFTSIQEQSRVGFGARTEIAVVF